MEKIPVSPTGNDVSESACEIKTVADTINWKSLKRMQLDAIDYLFSLGDNNHHYHHQDPSSPFLNTPENLRKHLKIHLKTTERSATCSNIADYQ